MLHDSHTDALATDGEVYAWGSYRHGSGVIGLTLTVVGKKGLHFKIFPTSDDTTAMATKIASGNDHTVIMTDGGDIYTNGTGEQGQLGWLRNALATEENEQLILNQCGKINERIINLIKFNKLK